jgi:PAS domain S-box-containing protein
VTPGLPAILLLPPLPHPWWWLLPLLLLSAALLLRRGRRRLHAQLRQLASENRELRQQREAAAQRCQDLLDNAGDAIFFIDPQSGLLREMNRRAEQLLGYSAEEVRVLPPESLFPGRQRRRYLRLLERVRRHGYAEDEELLFHRRDGSRFIGAVHARLGGLGETQVVHVVLRDVSATVRAERELRQKNRDLSLVNAIARQVSDNSQVPELLDALLARLVESLAAAGGGVYLAGTDGTSFQLVAHKGVEEDVRLEIGHISPGSGLCGRVAATGQPRSAADLRTDRRLRSAAVRRAGWRGFQAIPLTAKETTIGVVFLFRRVRHVPRRDEANLLLAIGRLLGAALEGNRLLEDLQWQNRLTQASNRELQKSRRRLEENLSRTEEANRALAQLDRMKSSFLALASHELRTPLTCVLAGSELLTQRLADRLDPEDRDILAAVGEGGRRLEILVRDLLESARLEARGIYLARQEVDLPALLTEIGTEFGPVLAERRLSYRLGEFPPAPRCVGDAHHLKQAFRRLLENAVKFTPAGGEIEVAAQLRSAAELRAREEMLRPFAPSFFAPAESGPMLQVTMRDNGIGIPPEEHLRVFERFYGIGEIAGHFSSRTRFGGKGVGLGLSLVKGMIEAHGGMIWVESAGSAEAPAGSAFHVLLPLAGAQGGGDAPG